MTSRNRFFAENPNTIRRRSTRKNTKYTRKYTKKGYLDRISDIGYRNTSYIRDNNPEKKYFSHINSINFTCDVLQYLIKYQKFNIQLNKTLTDRSVYGLCVNDTSIPMIYDFELKKHNTPNLIVNIQIHNLFDAVKTLILDKPNLKPKELFNGDSYDYNRYLELMRDYYFSFQEHERATSQAYIIKKVHLWDKNVADITQIPISCSSDYGEEPVEYLKHTPRKDDILKKDFIIAESLAPVIINLILKYYGKSISLSSYNTYYFDKDGNIYPTVIIDEMPFPGIANKRYLIIGTKYGLRQIANNHFAQLPEYTSILDEQSTRYEEWVKEYTFQELGKSSGRSASEMTFGDYIMNKKKIAGIDIEYIKKMGLLSREDTQKLEDFAKWKTDKMCQGKFNKPNMSLQYIWNILEITFESADTTSQITKIQPMAYTIREINENHTEVLKRLQRLSWTEMLYRNNVMPDGSNENLDYKQVFTECDISYEFKLISYYIHPLNYKTNYFYKENKIIPLEELIANSAIKCDGQYPGMEKYVGLPFYAVVPIEITNLSYLLNSSYYFSGFKCNMPDSTNTNNGLQQVEDGTELAINMPGTMRGSMRGSMSGGGNAAARKNNKSKKLTNAQNSNNADKILDKTVIIDSQYPRENRSSLETQKYLERLFKNSEIKVYSSFTTPNGLLMTILYDSHPERKKFYYLVLEIDIIEIVEYMRNDFYRPLYQYASNKVQPRNVYGVPKDKAIPILNIRLVKEFKLKDKVFTTLGKESIYKEINGLHDFFTKDKIQLKLDDKPTITIDNFYRYILLSLINKINPVKDFLKKWIDILNANDSRVPMEYYRVKESVAGKYVYSMVPKTELLGKAKSVNWNVIPDSRNETEKIEEILFPNNNVFITIGNKYVFFLNKYHEDVLTTKYVPPYLRHYYKFTAWVIHKDYLKQILDITDFSQSQIPINNFQDVLYGFTSVQNADDIFEINAHITAINKFILEFIIKLDENKCKSFKPRIFINPFSDISSSILHLHFNYYEIHIDPLKFRNLKNELLDSEMNSIYNLYTTAGISYERLFNNSMINSNLLYNSYLSNYIPTLKLSGIFNLQ